MTRLGLMYGLAFAVLVNPCLCCCASRAWAAPAVPATPSLPAPNCHCCDSEPAPAPEADSGSPRRSPPCRDCGCKQHRADAVVPPNQAVVVFESPVDALPAVDAPPHIPTCLRKTNHSCEVCSWFVDASARLRALAVLRL